MKSQRDSIYVSLGVYGAVGFQLALSVVIGLLSGNCLDQKFGTEPYLGVLGLLLGSVAGFWNLLRLLNWNQKRKGQKKN